MRENDNRAFPAHARQSPRSNHDNSLADGDASPSGMGNSISPTIAAGGQTNQQSNASDRIMSPADDAKGKKEYKLLSQAVIDAELLAIYLSRNGISVSRNGADGTAKVLRLLRMPTKSLRKAN